MKNVVKDYFVITLGCFLLAIAIECFYLPHNLVTGGFSGLAIILTRFFESRLGLEISVSVINLCLNLPLFIVTFFLLGYKMVIRSFYSTIVLSLSLSIVALFPQMNSDLFIAALFGGVFSGAGLGLVFSRFSTTGGTDLISMIINKYVSHINVSKLLFVIDSSIIVLGLFVFGAEKCMYALVAVFVCTKSIDAVLEGLSFAKVAYIITDKYEEVSDKILKELERGVTGLESIGMYTKKQRVTLMVVIATKELPKLKIITKSVDENAFIIVSEAREVFGEGFGRKEVNK